MNPKFADAVFGHSEPDGDEPEGGEDESGSADNEMGNQLKSAIKNGDGAAICEAVRRIMGS